MVSLIERQHVFSFEEFVDVTAHGAQRLEFWAGTILDMSGGSPRHSAICGNIVGLLHAQLRGRPCRVYDANLRVRSVVANRATYADATVVCGELERDPADKTRQTVLNPKVVVEVSNPSTESDDRGLKLDCYKTIASLDLVVLVAQEQPQVTVYRRQSDGSFGRTCYDAGAVELQAIGCSLPIAEIYENLPEG
jgi:Uma2 family endonuclease